MTAIKVLHYLRHLGLGGTEKTCQLFFEHASNNFEVAVAYEATGNHPRIHEFAKAASVNGGKLFEIDSYGPNKHISSEHLQRVIHEFKPDILHVYRSGYKEFPEPGFDISVDRFVETNVFGFYDANPLVSKTLFMSKWLMNNTVMKISMAGKYTNPSRFDYVNNPVELPYTSAKLPIKERWGDNVITVGRVGRPDNGIYNSVHVEAVRLLRLQGYDVRFIVVAPPSNMLKDLIDKEIPFHVVEPTVEPLLLSMAYNSMDIYAHARADGETFGVNIAEAMIHRLPVVTHIATPSFPEMGVFQSQTELVTHNVTGLIVNNNPFEYAEALKTIIDNPSIREKYASNGFDKAMKEYHVSACVKKLESIYMEIVK